MSAQDLYDALKLIDGDPAVCEQVAGGDLSAVAELDLSDEEKGLLQGAADDYPEVAGFAGGLFTFPGGGFEKVSPGLGAVDNYFKIQGFYKPWDKDVPGGQVGKIW